MTALVTLAFLANVVTFALAMPRFDAPQGWPTLMRWLSACGMLAAINGVYCLIAAPASPARQLAAVWLAVASQLLFRHAFAIAHRHRFAIAFSRQRPGRIVREGVYRWLRHPLYTAYAMNWAVVSVGSAHVLGYAGVLLMGGFYLSAAIQENRLLEGGVPSSADSARGTSVDDSSHRQAVQQYPRLEGPER